MSDQDAATTDVPAEATSEEAAGVGATAGSLLREAREAAGLHIAALAVSLKVPVRKLEALEGNQFDELPDAVFVRALAASVCRTLKIDAAPVLLLLPTTSAPRLTQDNGGLNAPFRSAGDVSGQSRLDQLSRPMVLAVLALLMGALVLIFLPSAKMGSQFAAPAGEGFSGLPSPDKPTIPVTEPAATTAAVALAPQSTPVAAPASSATGSAVTAAPPVQPGNPSAGTVATASAVTSGSPSMVVAPTASGVLVLKANAESWVEVTDAKDVVVVRRILGAGEAVGASGVLPLRVIVGRANVTTAQIRGKAFDLAPVSSDNVARFEVK